jgi:hypothetical protein
MKYLTLLALATISFGAHANSLEDAIRKVEAENGANCTKISTSTSICTGAVNGAPATCFYNVKFSCANQEGIFGVKVKMMSTYSVRDNAYIQKVRKVIITK